MRNVIVKRADEIAAGEIAAWRAVHGTRATLTSPYFSPEFFLAVSQVSRSARAVIARDEAGITAILPLHYTASGHAVPIGGPLNDLHGVLTVSGCTIPVAPLLAAAGTPLMHLRHAPIAAAGCGAVTGHHGFYVVDLANGFADWESQRASLAKSAFRAIRTRTEKAAKQHGGITFTFDDATPATLERLLHWKSAQYAVTRQPNVLARPWVRALIERLLAAPRSAPLRAQMSSLHFGDTLVAVHLGLRSHSVLHYWFPAYDPAFAELSPGNLLLYRMIGAAAAEGVTAVHLGAGEVRYKQEFANAAIPVVATTLFAGSLAGCAALMAGAIIDRLGAALPERWRHGPAKALKRLDRELSLRAA